MAIMVGFIAIMASCNDPQSPGYTYFPDMAYTTAFKTYTENPNFDDSTSARLPVKGTIPRGMLPDNVENSMNYLYGHYTTGTEAERAEAGNKISNPLPLTEEILAEGKRLYNINCAICHGSKGEGDGFIVENEKFPAVPPAYTAAAVAALTDGQLYHAITYGKNMMGAYASQLDPMERWKVVHYINALQGDHKAENNNAGEESEESAEGTEGEENMEDSAETDAANG